ncbi:MAG: glycosyltransferase [Opitutaceae bacterium]
MKICFFTNTFLPHVGGVARSVETFLECFRKKRHRVLVVAPEFSEGPAPRRIERAVERVPAIQNFNGSDFSVRLPLGAALSKRLDEFPADILHTHHPFLLGDTALRVAASRALPVVFTHHTLYEQYTHYMPFDSERMQEFVIELATRFANRCNGVIAPSESVAKLIASRGVTSPIRVVPTGIDTAAIGAAKRQAWRNKLRLAEADVVIGHVGRLAEEKNLGLLAESVVRALKRRSNTHFVVVGTGPARGAMETCFETAGVHERVHFLGTQKGRKLHEAYAAMDIFVFTSSSETQGLVVAEAMAARLPVVAIDASGVREVVKDKENGRLLPADASSESIARALVRLIDDAGLRRAWSAGAERTAADFDRMVTADRALAFYQEIVAEHRRSQHTAGGDNDWDAFLERLAIEGGLVADKFGAMARALMGTAEDGPVIRAG